ncbi:DedA family protein [Bradyrhizobium oligotrophicum S58]
MLQQILANFASWIVETIAALGYFGLAILMAIESACIPLPSEIIMPFAGYLALKGQFNLVGAATVGAIGCNLGSTVAYVIAAKGGRKAIERWGRYVLLRPGELAQSERFFARYGSITVFIGRLLPIVRTFIAFPAGLARMPMVKFQVFTFLGSWPWCFALAYAGFLLGEHWETDPAFRDILHRFDAVIILAILTGLGWFAWTRLRLSR